MVSDGKTGIDWPKVTYKNMLLYNINYFLTLVLLVLLGDDWEMGSLTGVVRHQIKVIPIEKHVKFLFVY
jgi:hypothetical protein